MWRSLCWLLAWTICVLYPNPVHLVGSLHRAWSPPMDGNAVQRLAATLPDDPHMLETMVNTTLVRYAVPWQTYGVPWYFPIPSEVLERGEGDCQAQAVVLASLLRAKGIPARLVGSFDHLWVDYPGKVGTPSEQMAVAIVAQQPDGHYRFQYPAMIDWRASWEIERAYFWDAMPQGRVVLLVAGWIVWALRRPVANGTRTVRRWTEAIARWQWPMGRSMTHASSRWRTWLVQCHLVKKQCMGEKSNG